MTTSAIIQEAERILRESAAIHQRDTCPTYDVAGLLPDVNEARRQRGEPLLCLGSYKQGVWVAVGRLRLRCQTCQQIVEPTPNCHGFVPRHEAAPVEGGV